MERPHTQNMCLSSTSPSSFIKCAYPETCSSPSLPQPSVAPDGEVTSKRAGRWSGRDTKGI